MVFMGGVFCLGYFFIIFENISKVDKAAAALCTAALCWIIQFSLSGLPIEESTALLHAHLSETSQIVFFLLGALGIVEIIAAHKGFTTISDCLQIRSKRKLLWAVGGLTFFLSAVLDNLTTTVVMLALMRRMVEKGEERWLMGAGVVIAANAGGVWSPIGDVTTTMLWIGGQISASAVALRLFFPSLVCAAVALFFLSLPLKGKTREGEVESEEKEPHGKLLFVLGLFLLALVPVVSCLTGLPPFLGVLFALALLWLVTDLLHGNHSDRSHLRVPYVLPRVDLSGTLFFLGALLSVGALQAGGGLERLAGFLETSIGSHSVLAALIGLVSAVVDNVPLVAATCGMYDLAQFPMNSPLWLSIALCAGTGGSILLIGSAAGVVFMNKESVPFFWYLKRVSLAALLGYFAGFAYYVFLDFLFPLW